MSKVILSVNVAPSSLKLSVFSYDAQTPEPKKLASIAVTGFQTASVKLRYDRTGQQVKEEEELSRVKTQEDALKHALRSLQEDSGLEELSSTDDIAFACHRIPHGDEDYDKPIRIGKDTLQHLSDLAPFHNAPAVELVQLVQATCPKTTNIAFFDTAFHDTIPPPTRTYAIDLSTAEKFDFRKHGSHGLSYSFITKACTYYLQSYPTETNLIIFHIGDTVSACCIEGGKSVDATDGVGLPGARSSGDVDPSVVATWARELARKGDGRGGEMYVTQVERALKEGSGWQALTGMMDFAEITEKAFANPADEGCRLAFDLLVDRMVGYIGSYFLKLGGEVNALVFAGGIGEGCARLREEVSRKLAFIGFIHSNKNNDNVKAALEKGEVVVDCGAEGAEHRILVCRTDEGVEMVRECASRMQEFKTS